MEAFFYREGKNKIKPVNRIENGIWAQRYAYLLVHIGIVHTNHLNIIHTYSLCKDTN